MKRLVLGTRGSDLARAQTALVEKALRATGAELEIAIEVITTRGDEQSRATEKHGRKGLFTAEIERALLEREIDVAVHSAKDLPSELTPGLEICAVLPRAAVEDVLIAKEAVDFNTLDDGATVGTSSVRRQHQLRWLRPDVKVVDLRGNVPTRLRKFAESSWDAIVLARAGLERLDLHPPNFRISILPRDEFLPAGGQGIIAMQIRNNEEETRQIVVAANDNETLLSLRAEREFLRLLQGDCGTPVGVFATNDDSLLTMQAQLFEEGRTEPRAATLQKNVTQITPEALAAELLELMHGR